MSENDRWTSSFLLSDKRKSTDMEARDEIKLNEILLVSEATCIPAACEMLVRRTGVRPNSAVIDPATAVAFGANILACMDNRTVDMQVHATRYVLPGPSTICIGTTGACREFAGQTAKECFDGFQQRNAGMKEASRLYLCTRVHIALNNFPGSGDRLPSSKALAA